MIHTIKIQYSKNILTLLILLLIFTSCSGQNDGLLNEKSKILKNYSESLIQFSKIANVIDSDSESYWAYQLADSTLATIDNSGKNYFADLNKIYSAYSHIFYGMSYTRTVLSLSRGDDYSFEELNSTIIQPSSSKVVDYLRLSENELSSIYSIINFYKVSRMQRYDNMLAMFQNNSIENENIFKNHSELSAYRITSFKNKKLFFMTFAGLIVDLYSINHQDVEESVYNNYVQNLIKLGEKMDEIPRDNDIIKDLNEQQYYSYILKGSEVQTTMLNLLIDEIKILEKQQD